MARVSDFGFTQKALKKGEEHRVNGSLYFLPQFIWTDIFKQRYVHWKDGFMGSSGHQSQKADIFALGVTFQADLVQSCLEQMADAYGLSDLFKDIPEEHWVHGPLSDVEILEISSSHPGRSLLIPPHITKKGSESLVLFPTREDVYSFTYDAIRKLEGHLQARGDLTPERKEELVFLSKFARLAKEMQSPIENQVPDLSIVQNDLKRYAKKLDQLFKKTCTNLQGN